MIIIKLHVYYFEQKNSIKILFDLIYSIFLYSFMASSAGIGNKPNFSVIIDFNM